MERPPKQARRSLADAVIEPLHVSGGGFTEGDFCGLLKDESNSDSGKGTFLSWLSSYIGSEAVYQLSRSTLRLLHGWLVLQLGCTFSSGRGDVDSSAINRLILRCLRQIYKAHPITVLLNPQELEESMKAHMRQAIRMKRDSANTEERESNLALCLSSVDFILGAQIEHYGRIVAEYSEGDEEFKDFLLTVLGAYSKDNIDGAHATVLSLSQLLTRLSSTTLPIADNVDSPRRWAEIAKWVADTYASNKSTPQLSRINHRYQTLSEWLFQVECFAYHGHSLCSDVVEIEQDELVRIALEPEKGFLSARAGRCLAHLVLKSPPSESLMRRLVRVFGFASHSVKIQVLPCFQGLDRQCWPLVMLSSFISNREEPTIKNIVSSLVDLILTAPEHDNMLNHALDWTQDAARLLYELLSLVRSDTSLVISQHDILSICFALLDSSRPEAIKCAVDILQDFVQHGTFPTAHIADLFQSLATPLLGLSSDIATKEKTMSLFVLLTRQRPLHLSHLVRIPRALEGLVRSAATMSPDDGPSSNAARQGAISILLRMAEDPYNHRILAKQTGLLSLLIRYVRDEDYDLLEATNQEETATVALPTRDEMKVCILRIAAAL